MILVRSRGDLVLIKQLDHAALSGDFAAHWGNEAFEAPAPNSSAVLAASIHDEGWRTPDNEFLYDPRRKRPLFFLDMDIRDHTLLYAEGVNRVAAQDPYAGLLVSMHGTGIYLNRWGIQPGVRMSGFDDTWPAIIDDAVLKQETLQSSIKLKLIKPDERRSVFERRLWANYELLQYWDRVSLFICRRDMFKSEEVDLGLIPTSLEGTETVQARGRSLGDGRVELTPFPLADSGVAFKVPTLRIVDRDYETESDLHEATANARPDEINVKLIAP